MKLQHFNAAILSGWLLVLVGSVLVDPGYGLAAAGLLLLGLAFGVARLAGGIYIQATNDQLQQKAD